MDTDAVPQNQPAVVVVAGPAGSGKSHLCDLLLAVLNRRGGAVLIGRDLYKKAHPHYDALMRSDDLTAGVRVRPDVLRWQAEVEAYVRLNRFDAVLEDPIADLAQALATARTWRAAGYRVEVVALATSQAEAQLSGLARYLTQVDEQGAGRSVSWGNLENCTRNLPLFLKAVEAERLTDQVMVVRRSLHVLYRTELTADGTSWCGPAGAPEALTAEWARPWTAPESWVFRRRLASAEQRLHPLVPQRRLAVAGGLERAFALAEPVRRQAQALAVAPGVDYHRLSASEHAWFFDELIVPMFLGAITPQDDPVSLYVMGPQGSGKSHTARALRRALRTRRPTRIYYRAKAYKDLDQGAAARAGMRQVADANGRLAPKARRGLANLSRLAGDFPTALAAVPALGWKGRHHRVLGDICWPQANTDQAVAAFEAGRAEAEERGAAGERAMMQVRLALALSFADPARAATELALAHQLLEGLDQRSNALLAQVVALIKDAGTDGVIDRARSLNTDITAAGLPFLHRFVELAVAFHHAVRGDEQQLATTIDQLRQLTASGDFAYFVDIAHYMGGLPASHPTATIWTDDPAAVRDQWRALVIARQGR